MAYPYPTNELKRLEALKATGIMNTGSTPEFDAITELASSIFNAPMSVVAFIGDDFQWFKARLGLDIDQMRRESSFSKYTILQNEVLVVNDTTKDERFNENPLVTGEPHIRFYAGVPISLDGKTNIAAIGVTDTKPRTASDAQITQLKKLANIAAALVRAHQAANEAKKLEMDARQRGKLLSQTERISKIGAWAFDTRTQEIKWSPQTYEIHQLSPTESISLERVLSFNPSYEHERIHKKFNDCLNDGIPYELECDFITALGNKRRVLMMAELEHSEAGDRCLIGTIKDITDEHENAKRLWDAAHIDTLTGIANRFAFQHKLDSLAERSSDDVDCNFKMLLIDLDGFKDINDSFGHLAGDKILCSIAKRIEDTIPENAFCARLGGDEFAVLMGVQNEMLKPEDLASELIEVINLPVPYEGHEISVGASIGISLTYQETQSCEEFQQQADLALYHAKQTGRGVCETYNPSLTEAFEEKRQAFELVKEAIHEGRLLPHYQPIFDLSSQRIKGVEALARIQNKDGSIVGPAKFWHALFEPKSALAVDETILDIALRDFAEWKSKGLDIDFISINASSLCIQSMDYVERVLEALAHNNLQPHHLKIEVVENIFLDDADSKITHVLERLSEAGVIIALDDFG
ncbi:sensor domain-containing phosphodiesterase, partial [Ahrensia kielensis]|uniref:sensor domain-containing phosphodiesterase n=1 Tax=Ahrensia kielensis TaxID=76980 RepID=UPI00038060CA